MFCTPRVLYTTCSVHHVFCTPRVLYTTCSVHHVFCTPRVLYTTCSVHHVFCTPRVLYTTCSVHHVFSTPRVLYTTCSVHHVPRYGMLDTSCRYGSIWRSQDIRSAVSVSSLHRTGASRSEWGDTGQDENLSYTRLCADNEQVSGHIVVKLSILTDCRLDELSAQKPISQLIDNGMNPNRGTGSQNPE